MLDSSRAEWLKYHYEVLGKSQKMIAEEVGACRPTIRDWLEELGIYVRSKSETDKLSPGQSERCFRERARALLEVSASQFCEECERGPEDRLIEVHHLDGNLYNNSLENLQWLCRGCHTILHRRGGE